MNLRIAGWEIEFNLAPRVGRNSARHLLQEKCLSRYHILSLHTGKIQYHRLLRSGIQGSFCDGQDARFCWNSFARICSEEQRPRRGATRKGEQLWKGRRGPEIGPNIG